MQWLATDKENAIHAWASAALMGETVIWEYEDGKKPNAPFATLNIISGPRQEGAAAERYKELDTIAYVIRKSFSLSVQTFGPDALVRLTGLLNSLYLPTKLAMLQAAGFAVWGNTDPIDITGLLDTRSEGRAEMEIRMAYAEEVTDIPGEIHSVGIRGTADAHAREINISITP